MVKLRNVNRKKDYYLRNNIFRRNAQLGCAKLCNCTKLHKLRKNILKFLQQRCNMIAEQMQKSLQIMKGVIK